MLYDFTMRAAAMAVLCALAECLMPEGKLKRTVRFCVGLIFVLAIAAPIAGCMREEVPIVMMGGGGTFESGMTYEELLEGYIEEHSG